jgi:ATP-dependent RNA helicase DDX18/HAS1
MDVVRSNPAKPVAQHSSASSTTHSQSRKRKRSVAELDEDEDEDEQEFEEYDDDEHDDEQQGKQANVADDTKDDVSSEATSVPASSQHLQTILSNTAFDSLDILDSTKKAVKEMGFTTMTEIQARAIPPALAGMYDDDDGDDKQRRLQIDTDAEACCRS